MPALDANALTGTINICVNKYAEGGPEYRTFYPVTKPDQIIDFDNTVDTRVKNIINNYNSTIKAVNLTATTKVTTKDLTASNDISATNTITGKDVTASNSIKVNNGSTAKITLSNNGTVTATTFIGALSGNSNTASTLFTARAIDGISFKGNKNIHHYGTCSTASGTSDKTVDFASGISNDDFVLSDGATVTVRFTAENTSANPKLKIGSNSKPIYYRGVAIPVDKIKANSTHTFVYENGVFHLIGDLDTDTHHLVNLIATSSTGTANAATTNGNTTLRLVENGTARATIPIKGAKDTSVTSDSSGVITVSTDNTKVTQNASNANVTYPVLLSYTADKDNSNTEEARFGAGVKVNPSTSTVIATTFKGNLSGTATNATNVAQTKGVENKTYPILATASADLTQNVVTGTIFGTGIKINPSTSTMYATTFSGKLSGTATLTGTPTAPTAALGTATTQIATTAFVNNAISNLVGAAPATLDTLAEIANAINKDPSVYTTLNNAITGKQDKHAALTSISGLSTSADKMIYTTAANTYATTTLTSFVRSILDDANASAVRSTIDALGKSENAVSATKLATAQSINIQDSDGTNTGTAISFNGTSAGIIKLPAKIKATLTGTADRAIGDSSGNNIISTYETKANAITGLNINDKTITYTKGDSTTGTLTTQDKRLQQDLGTANNTYPILAVATSNLTSSVTSTAVFGKGIKINPSTSTIIATTFSGNATSADKATEASTAETAEFAISAREDEKNNNIIDTYATKEELAANYVPAIQSRLVTILQQEISATIINTNSTTKAIYPYKYEVSDPDITANDIVEVIIRYESVPTARYSGMYPIAESAAGKFTLLTQVPIDQPINVIYRIFKGTATTGSTTTVNYNIYMERFSTPSAIQLTASAWKSSTEYAGYKWRYEIKNTKITANDVVDVYIDNWVNPVDSVNQKLQEIKICPVVKTAAGYVYLYAENKPDINIDNVRYRIYQGAATEKNDTQVYMPKLFTRSVSLAVSSWVATTTSDPIKSGYKYTITNSDIKATDVVEVTVLPSSISVTKSTGFNPVASAVASSFTLYAETKPTAAITINWTLYHGDSANNTNAVMDYMQKRKIVSTTLTATNWKAQSYNGYNYYYNLSDSTVLASDTVDVVINAASQEHAGTSGVAPMVETLASTIKFRSIFQPTENIGIQYYVCQGATA